MQCSRPVSGAKIRITEKVIFILPNLMYEYLFELRNLFELLRERTSGHGVELT
jgi:hypothetical protein